MTMRAATEDLRMNGGATGRANPGDDAPSMAGVLHAWLDALANIARAINQDLPLRDLLRLFAETTRDLSGYDCCAILLHDDDHEALTVQGASGLSDAYVEEMNTRNPMRIESGTHRSGPSSRAYRSLRPVLIPDLLNDASSATSEFVIIRQGVRSLLSTPLISAGKALGVINCYTTTVHEFEAQEVLLMETIANQIAIAIERTAMRTQERAQIAQVLDLNHKLEVGRSESAKAENVHTDLMRVMVDGEGPEGIARVLADALGATVVFENSSGLTLAASSADGEPPDALTPAFRDDPDVREALDRSTGLWRTEAVPPPPGSATPHAGIVVPIVSVGAFIGRAWAFGPTKPFSSFDRRMLERGVVMAALALAQLRATQEVEWRLSGDFLEGLLLGVDKDATVVETRALHLGVDLARPHRILLIQPDTLEQRSGADPGTAATQIKWDCLRSVQRVIETLPSGGLAAACSDHVVALWPDVAGEHDATALANGIHSEIKNYTAAPSATVVLSESCRAVGDYPGAYQATINALELSRAAKQSDRVIEPEDLGVYRLLLQVRDPRLVLEFARHIMAPLHDAGDRYSPELVQTLRAYIDSGCRVKETAEELIIHSNTVKYRLKRISEMLDIDLRNPYSLLELALALHVERLFGVTGTSTEPR